MYRWDVTTLVLYSWTDGPKPTNSDDETWTSLTLVKWAPTLHSSAFAQLFHTQNHGGDTFANQLGFTPNDPDFRKDARTTVAELGYQFEFRPGYTLLIAGQRQFDRIRTKDRMVTLEPVSVAPQLFPDLAVQTTATLDVAVREPFYDFQAPYLGRLGRHQAWLAVD